MMQLSSVLRRPILWLLGAALIGALATYRDFGLTWDEPLFYKYADALAYAYTPANWLDAEFDLSRSYGPSGDDHKTRGPGYLLIASLPSRALQSAGLDTSSAWHLINSVTFLFGIFFVYRLCRWMGGNDGAVIGAALFASQPLLWGHAFINPKDMPFMVLFAGAVWLGVRMVDRLAAAPETRWGGLARNVVLPAIVLGLCTSNRVLGPLAGVLVVAYWIARLPTWKTAPGIVLYTLAATATMFATWPYLWEDAGHFLEVFGLMAQNPTVLPVLFADSVYRANELPLRYLPFFLATAITEPVWPFFAMGLAAAARLGRGAPARGLRLAVLLGWLVLPVAYALLARPPLYDGMRHFLFVLPPAFILAGVGTDLILRHVRAGWARLAVAIAILAPGLTGIAILHPYEYAYYNAFVGGTAGAFRHYETEYWLTCYKESVERINETLDLPARLFVHREAAVAAPYAAPNLTVLDQRGSTDQIRQGDFVLVNTRTNEDERVFRDAPAVISVGRAGATFCVVKIVP